MRTALPHRCFFVLALSLLVWALTATNAHAGALVGGLCPAGAGMVQAIVTCVQDYIIIGAYYFVYGIYPMLEGAIQVFLILCVVFFGIRMVMPMMEKPGRDSMTFLLKFAAVVLFTANMDLILFWLVGAPDLAIAFAALFAGGALGEYIADLGPGALFAYLFGIYPAGILGHLIEIVTDFSIFDFGAPLRCPGGVAINIWVRLDCLLDVIIGVNTAATLSGGMLGFFFHNFFVGSVGVLIFMLGLWMMFSIVLMLLGAIHTYLMAVMMICLLVIVGVLFCPLIMFKNTFDFFQKWVRMMIANLIIPMVLFAYANVMISAFDIVLYSGEHSVFRTFAGDVVDNPAFSIHEYMYGGGMILEVEDKGPIHDQRAANRFNTPGGTVIQGEIDQFGEYGGAGGLFALPGQIGEIPIALPMQTIDYNVAAGAVGAASGPALMEAVLASMIVAALVSYVLVAMMKFVPMLAEGLAGGVTEAPSIGRVGMNELPMVGSRGAGGLAESFRSRMGSMVGRR